MTKNNSKDLIPPIPDNLKEDLLRTENDVIVFFGNGISRLSGVISWEELGIKLLKKLLDEKKIDYEVFNSLKLEKNTIEIISIFNEKMRLDYSHKYKEKIVNCIESFLKPERKEEFRKLYDCLSKLNATEYITTNYITGFDDKTNSKTWYLHGKIDKIKNDIDSFYDNELVLTLSQYLQKYKKDSETNKKLSDKFSEKTVVFVGFGFQEYEIIQHLVPPPSNKQNHHYLLKPYCSYENDLKKEYEAIYRNLSTDIIWYDISKYGHSVLEDILKSWSDEIQNILFKRNLKLKEEKEILKLIVK